MSCAEQLTVVVEVNNIQRLHASKSVQKSLRESEAENIILASVTALCSLTHSPHNPM